MLLHMLLLLLRLLLLALVLHDGRLRSDLAGRHLAALGRAGPQFRRGLCQADM